MPADGDELRVRSRGGFRSLAFDETTAYHR
jgi:hypothetical protein